MVDVRVVLSEIAAVFSAPKSLSASIAALETSLCRPLEVESVEIVLDEAGPAATVGSASVPLHFEGVAIGRLITRSTRSHLGTTLRDALDAAAFPIAAAIGSKRREEIASSMYAIAHTDPLTGIPNRRHFDGQLTAALDDCRRNGWPIGLILIDVDLFKMYNDVYGHPAGDECLRRIADVLRRTSRPGDTVARVGGEEFAVVLPQSEIADSIGVAERMRSALWRLELRHRGSTLGRVTASFGVAGLATGEDISSEVLVAHADRALYQAKLVGRNRVCAGAYVSSSEIVERRSETASRLPAVLSRFIGRERELQAIATALGDHRFVSLVGPLGSGSSRLLLEAARLSGDNFADGVLYFDLADYGSPRSALDAAFSLARVARTPAAASDAISAQRSMLDALLVLDNAGAHEALAPELAQILAHGGSLRCLLATTQPLGIAGEVVVPVGPLAIADAEELLHDRLLASAAFAIPGDPTPRPVFERMARTPLEICLLAPRLTSTGSPPPLAGGLETRLKTLFEAASGALSAAARTLFDALLGFRGIIATHHLHPFIHACDITGSANSIVDELVASAFLEPLVQGESEGYRIPDAIGRLARARVLRSHTGAQIARPHAIYMAARADDIGAARKRGLSTRELSQLVDDLPQFDVAAEWSIVHEPDVHIAARILVGLSYILWSRGLIALGMAWHDRIMAAVDRIAGDALRGNVYRSDALFATFSGRVPRAIASGEKAIALLTAAGSASATATARSIFSQALIYAGDADRAYEQLNAGLGESESSGEWARWGILQAKLAWMDLDVYDNPEQARVRSWQAMPLLRTYNEYRNLAIALRNLAEANRRLGHLDLSADLLLEAIEIADRLGNRMKAIAFTARLATIEAVRGSAARTRRLVRDLAERVRRHVDEGEQLDDYDLPYSLMRIAQALGDQPQAVLFAGVVMTEASRLEMTVLPVPQREITAAFATFQERVGAAQLESLRARSSELTLGELVVEALRL